MTKAKKMGRPKRIISKAEKKLLIEYAPVSTNAELASILNVKVRQFYDLLTEELADQIGEARTMCPLKIRAAMVRGAIDGDTNAVKVLRVAGVGLTGFDKRRIIGDAALQKLKIRSEAIKIKGMELDLITKEQGIADKQLSQMVNLGKLKRLGLNQQHELESIAGLISDDTDKINLKINGAQDEAD